MVVTERNVWQQKGNILKAVCAVKPANMTRIKLTGARFLKALTTIYSSICMKFELYRVITNDVSEYKNLKEYNSHTNINTHHC